MRLIKAEEVNADNGEHGYLWEWETGHEVTTKYFTDKDMDADMAENLWYLLNKRDRAV